VAGAWWGPVPILVIFECSVGIGLARGLPDLSPVKIKIERAQAHYHKQGCRPQLSVAIRDNQKSCHEHHQWERELDDKGHPRNSSIQDKERETNRPPGRGATSLESAARKERGANQPEALDKREANPQLFKKNGGLVLVC